MHSPTRSALISLILFALLSGFPTSASASPRATYPADPTTVDVSSRSIPLPGGVVEYSSPTLADIDGDGLPEIITGTTMKDGSNNQQNRDAYVVVLRGDGRILWERRVDAPINSSPAVGDIDGDGEPEIVVSTGGDVSVRRRNSGLVAFDRHGNQLWYYPFLDHHPRDGYPDGAFSSPTLCDLEGDGDMEIIVGGWDQRIHVVDHRGRAVWENLNSAGPGYFNVDSSWSTAACADLNDDGHSEIIIGADIAGGGILPDGTRPDDGGYLYVFNKNGGVLARRFFPETIYSSPAVADLDRNGKPEIVVGTGWYWWNQKGRNRPSYVYAFDASRVFNGLHYADPAALPDLPGWPQQTPYPGFVNSPAIGDLDGDGDLEVVITSHEPFLQNDGIAGAGMVHAWHHNGQPVAGWPVYPKNRFNDDASISSSPILADVDADGQLEVLFAMLWDLHVYNANGTPQDRLTGGATFVNSPAVGDTDGDGRADIWIGSSHFQDPARGWMWHFEYGQVGSKPGPWPSFHGDAMNQGVFEWPPPRAKMELPVAELHLLVDIDAVGKPTTVSASLVIQNGGRQELSWSARYVPATLAATGADAARVQVTPASGSIPAKKSGQTTVTVKVDDLPLGEHRLGTVEFTVRDSKGPLPGSPVRLPVTIYKGVLKHTYLPLIKR